MGQALHGSAVTTDGERQKIQESQEILRALAALRREPEDRFEWE
jgi:hypothetical protein